MTAAPITGLVAVSSEWLVSVSLTFHETGAADLGRLVLEDALSGHAALLRPSVARLGERRVRVAFGLVAGSAGAAIADARVLLMARLLNVRPIPLWIPASLTAERVSPL